MIKAKNVKRFSFGPPSLLFAYPVTEHTLICIATESGAAEAYLRWSRWAEWNRAGLSLATKPQQNGHISFQNGSNWLPMFDSISLGNNCHRRCVFYLTSRLSFICFKVLASSTICTHNIQCKLVECADLFEGRKEVHLQNWTLIHAH